MTGANGQITLESDKVKRPTSGATFTFVIDNVTKDGWTYDSTANGDFDSDGITYPNETDDRNSITIP